MSNVKIRRAGALAAGGLVLLGYAIGSRYLHGPAIDILRPAQAAVSTCVGDCDGGGTVTVDEILTLVNIALGNQTVAACEAGDANLDGKITVDEILATPGCSRVPGEPSSTHRAAVRSRFSGAAAPRIDCSDIS